MSLSGGSLTSPYSIIKGLFGFDIGEDVFVFQDGKFYLGTIVEFDVINERCMVRFLNNTLSWSSIKADSVKSFFVLFSSSHSDAQQFLLKGERSLAERAEHSFLPCKQPT